MKKLLIIGVCLAIGGFGTAQAADDFYKGKTVNVYISASAGGGYDAYGRLLARHISRHLPGNPTVVGQNMPGAGGRKVANFLYNAAPKDGSAIAIMHHTTVYDAMFGATGVKFDSSKFNWLGSLDSFTAIGFVWHEAGIHSLDDAKREEIVIGSTGVGSSTYQYPNLLNNLVGTKFKIVTGYKGSTSIYHALEQGEVRGMMGTSWSQMRARYMRWLEGDKVRILVQFALEKHPEMLTVPLVTNLARTDEERRMLRFVFAGLQFSRPFLAPPGAPSDRVAILRTAFDAAAKDPALRAEAAKSRRNIVPMSGADIQKLVKDIYATPPGLVAKAKSMLTEG